MSFSSPTTIDVLLAHPNDPGNFSKLIGLLYTDLRQIAGRFFKSERSDHTLQPTALVHEVFLRLAVGGPNRYQNRAHFFGAAARSMRQILVDYARKRRCKIRGGELVRVPLEDEHVSARESPADLDYLALEKPLKRLKDLDPGLFSVVELRIFVGLTFEEIAELLDRGNSTVRKDWDLAKRWLERELKQSQL